MNGDDDDRPWWRGSRGGPSSRAVTLGVGLLAAAVAVIGVVASSGQGTAVDNHGDGNANVVGDGNSITVNNYGPGTAAPSPTATSSDATLCGDANSDVRGGWGPERPLFTTADPPDFATVNSIRDNKDVGDERGFLRVRDLTANGTFEHEMDLVPGHRYEIMLYAHEDPVRGSAAHADEPPVISVNLPTCTGNRIAVNGFVTSDDMFPRQVYDGATLTSKRAFNLSYVAGSARVVHSTGTVEQTVRDPESTLFTATGIGLRPRTDDPRASGEGFLLFSVDPQFAAA